MFLFRSSHAPLFLSTSGTTWTAGRLRFSLFFLPRVPMSTLSTRATKRGRAEMEQNVLGERLGGSLRSSPRFTRTASSSSASGSSVAVKTEPTSQPPPLEPSVDRERERVKLEATAVSVVKVEKVEQQTQQELRLKVKEREQQPLLGGVKSETKEAEEEEGGGDESSNSKPVVKKKKSVSSPLKVTKATFPKGTPPEGWEELYSRVATMRAPGGIASGAPVDSMGCAQLALQDQDPKTIRFQTLVGVFLSSQTKDEVTSAAVRKLQALPGGLSVDSILAADPEQVHDCIRAVGFHNTKLKNLFAIARILKDKYDGDIPRSVEEMSSVLPGVGPKMSHLCVQHAWGVCEGIGVDVHVHRITNKWRWHKTESPEQTRMALETWLPRDKWEAINPLLVGFGQKVCKSVKPNCEDCLANDICPAAFKW